MVKISTIRPVGFNYAFYATVCILFVFCMVPWWYTPERPKHVGEK